MARYCYFCRKETETKEEDCVVCGFSKPHETLPPDIVSIQRSLLDQDIKRLVIQIREKKLELSKLAARCNHAQAWDHTDEGYVYWQCPTCGLKRWYD